MTGLPTGKDVIDIQLLFWFRISNQRGYCFSKGHKFWEENHFLPKCNKKDCRACWAKIYWGC